VFVIVRFLDVYLSFGNGVWKFFYSCCSIKGIKKIGIYVKRWKEGKKKLKKEGFKAYIYTIFFFFAYFIFSSKEGFFFS
jgi:hypothetical protein